MKLNEIEEELILAYRAADPESRALFERAAERLLLGDHVRITESGAPIRILKTLTNGS